MNITEMTLTEGLKQRQGNAQHKEETELDQTRTKQTWLRNEGQGTTGGSSTRRRRRRFTRTVIIIAVSVFILIFSYTKYQSDVTKFATVRENLTLRIEKFKCSPSYANEIQEFPKCVPLNCGRFVTDKLIEHNEVELLLDLARRVITKAGSSGGASILDIHSGALSYGEKFLNVYHMPKIMEEFRNEHLTVYNLVKGKIKLAIAEQFGIEPSNLYLTYPTFFSQITNVTAKTIHDEYWHEHVDKETYPSFHYTSLLYLNTYERDFEGGRFIFVDGSGENRTTSTVEPKSGRVSAFTSGEENRHHVEQVTSGIRYAITISFTCDRKYAISDPKIALKV